MSQFIFIRFLHHDGIQGHFFLAEKSWFEYSVQWSAAGLNALDWLHYQG